MCRGIATRTSETYERETYYTYTLVVSVPSSMSNSLYFVDTPIGSVVISLQDGSIVYSTEAELYPKNYRIASVTFNSSLRELTIKSVESTGHTWDSGVVMPVIFTKFYD